MKISTKKSNNRVQILLLMTCNCAHLIAFCLQAKLSHEMSPSNLPFPLFRPFNLSHIIWSDGWSVCHQILSTKKSTFCCKIFVAEKNPAARTAVAANPGMVVIICSYVINSSSSYHYLYIYYLWKSNFQHFFRRCDVNLDDCPPTKEHDKDTEVNIYNIYKDTEVNISIMVNIYSNQQAASFWTHTLLL